MPFLEPVTLRGEHARLEPLSQDQCDGLTEAVSDGDLWKLWYTAVPTPEGMRKEIDRRLGLLAAGAMLAFTGVYAHGKIASVATHMNLESAQPPAQNGSPLADKRMQPRARHTHRHISS